MRRWLAIRMLPVLLSAGCAGRPATLDFRSPPAATDSALVRRILLAEDRRDSADAALTQGERSPDARIRAIAWRARARILDPLFRARDSLPQAAPARSWPEPGWKPRYRALTAARDDCAALRAGLVDSAWVVRLRAADLARASCASSDALVATLRGWVDSLPPDVSRRASGGVSWHAAAHGIVALARVRPGAARPLLAGLASHPEWHLRLYAARAAAAMSDTAALRRLARDPDDNVKEAALDGLSRLTAHENDSIYVAALGADGTQAVRAAAIALKGSTRPGVAQELVRTFERWVARANASERDARIALLDALGHAAVDDRPPAPRVSVPSIAVPLALGADVRLRVTMSPASGAGSFVVRLRGDVAPIMAARIFELAEGGYYDGGTWHRVEPDFVIQGAGHGDNEYVGAASYLRDELANIPHPRGTVGMSTRAHDTGDAQWFINLRDNPRLVTDYTVFAEVVDGMATVDDILEGDIIESIRGVNLATVRDSNRQP